MLPPHDTYFTIGETVGASGARFPDCGLVWQYTPPCVALDFWPICGAHRGAAYTTVTHWGGKSGSLMEAIGTTTINALGFFLILSFRDESTSALSLRSR